MSYNPPPLFVVGCPRSGTTLLAQLLQPTQWGVPFETHFITKYFKKLKKPAEQLSDEEILSLIRKILNERPVQQWKLGLAPQDILHSLSDRSYASIVTAICTAKGRSRNVFTWGDKTPHYILDLDILHELFPDSKYIYIVRDGRDVSLSLLRKPWGPNNVWACAKYWQACNAETALMQNLRDSNRLHTLKYEDLLNDPIPEIHALFEFLDENIDVAVIGKQIASIKPKNYNKWRKEMPQRNRYIFEAIANETLARFGYEREFDNPRVSPVNEFLWASHDKFLHSLDLLRLNTIDALKIRYFGMSPFGD